LQRAIAFDQGEQDMPADSGFVMRDDEIQQSFTGFLSIRFRAALPSFVDLSSFSSRLQGEPVP